MIAYDILLLVHSIWIVISVCIFSFICYCLTENPKTVMKLLKGITDKTRVILIIVMFFVTFYFGVTAWNHIEYLAMKHEEKIEKINDKKKRIHHEFEDGINQECNIKFKIPDYLL